MRRNDPTPTPNPLLGLWALAPLGWLFLEVCAVAWVGGYAGLLLTPLAFFGTSALGLLLLRGGGLRLALSLTRWGQARLAGEAAGDLPLEAAAPRLAAGLLLLLPGFCTDALGVLALVPPGSWWVRRQARRLVRVHQAAAEAARFGTGSGGPDAGPVTVDVEAVRVREVPPDPPPPRLLPPAAPPPGGDER